MTKNPIVVKTKNLLKDVINDTISKNNVSVYPVIDENNKLIGILRVIDVLKTGLYS